MSTDETEAFLARAKRLLCCKLLATPVVSWLITAFSTPFFWFSPYPELAWFWGGIW